MDKMKSAHVENHNMIEVHCGSVNMRERLEPKTLPVLLI